MPWTDEAIETARLRLRAFAERDKPAIVELWSNPDVRRFLGGPLDADTIASIEHAVVGERSDVFCVAERSTDRAIGTVNLDRHRGEPEVSYEFVPSEWRKGLAFEAVGAFLTWTQATHRDESVIAVTQTANVGSVVLLERLGFRFEREFEEFDAQQSQYRLVYADRG